MIHTIVDNIVLSYGRNITLVTGFFAKQSTGLVLVLVIEYMVTLYTILLATVVADKEVKEVLVKEDVDILPLTVNYRKNYAVVKILPGKEYLLHISEINWERLKQVEDVLKIGDFIQVKLMGIDSISKVRDNALFPNI